MQLFREASHASNAPEHTAASVAQPAQRPSRQSAPAAQSYVTPRAAAGWRLGSADPSPLESKRHDESRVIGKQSGLRILL
ncbi:hypothetical protein [Anaeromyxobacter sp. SG17]|uniref:hypothetical protein n=1 Tax=Anaeromyxobacter sp. SG17 TaxID=2925405 RepID=UPI001F575C40|nr:hypothetical protein [Anaeromyxobacter sp. SG17]